MADGNVSAYQLALALMGNPGEAYKHATDLLERASAVIRGLYGGGPELPKHAYMRAAENAIAATLRARRQLQADDRKRLQAALSEPPPFDVHGNGWKVRPKRPAPTLPPTGALSQGRTR